MLGITGNDIALLNDTDLRNLVAELCRTELHHCGFPSSGVTAGGDQNAPDGGLDVRVEIPGVGTRTNFIPRGNTGFQVKVPDMPASAIDVEMRPEGIVRPALQELANLSGAYIIVSAKGSTADKSLQRRRDAMRSALVGILNGSSLFLDFYDRTQIAAWVNLYPGIATWVRDRLGKPLLGWKGFGNWSAPLEPVDAEFIVDGGCRLHDSRTLKHEGLTIKDGIGRIREVLSREGGTARLIGLSGLGKTRLAQALFDARVGKGALDPGAVMYTDLGDGPTPSPRDLINNLIHAGTRIIVIVDNCNPETHRTIAAACSEVGSKVSLLTVEYDVGDDEPEGTEIFRLEAASNEIIERLITRRESHISQVDIRRIAAFSGGNSRIALALARTVRRGESVAHLADRELFARLFHQRRTEDTSLMRAAEACSMVYSFDGETATEQVSELAMLSELAGMSVDELFRHTAELKERDLLQQRSKWRAILPHALANKLAKAALERLLPSKINSVMIDRTPDRFTRSFSRRLGFLHDSAPAQGLVRSWCAEGNLLADLNSFDKIHFQIFQNVAPVVPEMTLQVIERTLSIDGSNFYKKSNREQRHEIASILKSLAYDQILFSRSIHLLIKMAINEPISYGSNNPETLFKELFHLCLSGTHATLQERLAVVNELLEASDPASQALGFAGLSELHETSRFSTGHSHDFGAHSRDYGWQPRTRQEVLDWYHAVIDYALRRIATKSEQRNELLSILASNFRGLWGSANLYDELEKAVASISAYGHWSEGWIAVRATLNFDGAGMPDEIRARLNGIEVKLRPGNLLDEARAFVFSKTWSNLDIGDGEDDDSPTAAGSAYQRADEKTVLIGSAAAAIPSVLTAIIPDLVRGNDAGRRRPFGAGLAKGTTNLVALFAEMVGAIASTPETERNIEALLGLLSQANSINPVAVNGFLDKAVTDEVLGPLFPVLQCSVEIDQNGVDRLLESLRLGNVPVFRYGVLAYGRATDPISSSSLSHLLSEISCLEEGIEVALDILSMKLHSLKDAMAEPDQDLINCGRGLFLKCDFSKPRHRIDYEMARVAELCLKEMDAAECTGQICLKISAAFGAYISSPQDYGDLLATLFKLQPTIALTAFLEGEGSRKIRWRFDEFSTNKEHPIGSIPMESLMTWANADPEHRYPALASVIPLFCKLGEENEEAISPIALQLLNASPDKISVLSNFSEQFQPSGWSGSLADIFDRRRLAIQKLVPNAEAEVNEWVTLWDQRLTEAAKNERLRDRVVETSFE